MFRLIPTTQSGPSQDYNYLQSGAKNPTAAKPSFVFSCFDIILIIGKVLMDLSGTVLGHFLFLIEINHKQKKHKTCIFLVNPSIFALKRFFASSFRVTH